MVNIGNSNNNNNDLFLIKKNITDTDYYIRTLGPNMADIVEFFRS